MISIVSAPTFKLFLSLGGLKGQCMNFQLFIQINIYKVLKLQCMHTITCHIGINLVNEKKYIFKK